MPCDSYMDTIPGGSLAHFGHTMDDIEIDPDYIGHSKTSPGTKKEIGGRLCTAAASCERASLAVGLAAASGCTSDCKMVSISGMFV